MKKIKEGILKLKEKAPKPKMMKEFLDFLKEYKVVALAIGFVMGLASTTLVKSLVNNIIMPLISPLIPGGTWQTAILTIWKFEIGWGAFIGEVINFITLALVIFLIVKFFIKEAKVAEK